MPSEATLLAGT